MTREIVSVSPSTTLAGALALTRKHGVRHLPVLEEDRLVGVVTDRDLRLALPAPWAESRDEDRKALGQRTVAELMVRDVVQIPPETLVEDAAKYFYENKIGCLPVMDGERLVGILTASDLLRAFVGMFGGGPDTSRLEIRMPDRPGELARVIRVIGIDNKINITGVVTLPPDDKGRAVTVLRLQTRKPADIIETLEKMGYEVGSPALDTTGSRSPVPA